MSEPIIPYEDPAWLVNYFAIAQRLQPDEVSWQEGSVTARQWLILIQHPYQINEHTLAALIDNIIIYRNQGSGWADLALRIRHWLRGLAVHHQAFAMQHYFGKMAIQQSDHPAWREGHRVAKRWYRLIGHPYPGEITAFLDEVDQMRQHYGRRDIEWYDLLQMITTWIARRKDSASND